MATSASAARTPPWARPRALTWRSSMESAISIPVSVRRDNTGPMRSRYGLLRSWGENPASASVVVMSFAVAATSVLGELDVAHGHESGGAEPLVAAVDRVHVGGRDGHRSPRLDHPPARYDLFASRRSQDLDRVVDGHVHPSGREQGP